MAGSPLVNRATAHQKRIHHQFVPGMGYIAHTAAPDLPAGANGTKNCNPPSGTKDGTSHIMQPPGGHPQMAMIWHAAESAWGPTKPGHGNRLAWEPAHLSKAGWEYIGPGDAPVPAPTKGGKGKRSS
jgi:hypothetical protein